MSAITFLNHKTQIPNWSPIHVCQPRSFAYKKNGFCISIYAENQRLYVLSTGLTASEQTTKDLINWCTSNYAATNIETLNNDVGIVIDGVWRPGLYSESEITQALKVNISEKRSAEQALYILIEKLYDLFIYIEPSVQGLNAYSHKTRELLILGCTEIENIWQKYMKLAGFTQQRFTTNDYVKLASPLHLKDYRVSLKAYPAVSFIEPFSTWNSANPTQSLPWYNSYNKTKHDRDVNFNEASLETCINVVAANIVLFCTRYSPYPLYHSQSIISSYFNQLFEVTLNNPDPKTFYVPDITFSNRRAEYVCGDAISEVEPWKIQSLIL